MDDQLNDEALIKEVLQGRKEAFATLVNRYKNRVYGLLRGMGAQKQDAQDLTQEAFIKAYRSLSSHQTGRSFSSWLYTIATNLLRDSWRRKQADPSYEHNLSVVEPMKCPETVYLQLEKKLEIHDILLGLSQHHRLVLLLRYTNDLSYEEIGIILDVPVSKVQNDLHRAKKKLKQLLKDKEVSVHEMLER
ncbi:RNA polymerase sigma-70 factor, ECF subfamily [Paenibacillus sp. 1_12]|uniref:RNA polymerase sigma factor n=1 Tax=Paenibacillus sp. 1_12 TaxID=1566278 RepID=UPI0008E34926|nr:RNA polymerase sigma factor [Paenibacillus sp. 1_12]SFM15244.1 RNA polymerase sigma-70 factor, ECF subfamily [Paenibacillus sp. 1_12]